MADGSNRGWPGWGKAVVSSALLLHAVAVLAGVLARPPSSALERSIASGFGPYYRLIDQGYSYRFYTSGAPPTPVLMARLEFQDGRTEELRIPDRSLRPRLRMQRHLALAYHLFEDVRMAGPTPDPKTGNSRSRLAESYARHLCRTHPGCRRVTLTLRDHLNPQPNELVEAARRGRVIDVEAPRFYGDPRRIGAYLCE